MLSRTLIQFSSFLSIAYAFPHKSTTEIQWSPCNKTELPSTLPLECGNLHVPLDYSDPSPNATLKLDLARIPAKEKPSKGSILTNFGGPGQPSRSGLASLGPILYPLSGGEYDIITFDPRGTGNTIPLECYDDADKSAQIIKELGSSKASDVESGELWAYATLVSNDCVENAKNIGSFMGTTFTARDLMSIVDVLDEDGMLRFWGFSYGTTLGATVAAMFPDRIDKMVLDGVQNVHEYYHAAGDFEEWTQSDDVFSGIFSSCVEAPEACALARPNVTAKELEQSVLELIETIKYHPIPLETTIFDYSSMKGLLASSLYATSGWASLSSTLDKLLKNDITDEMVAALEEAVAITPQTAAARFGLVGIHCSERDSHASSLKEFMPTINRLHNTSVIMADSTDAFNMVCAQWKMEAKERYEGDFLQIETKNPVLFVGNTYDSHTPLVSAFNVSAGFEDSVVLEVNGYGHCSTSLPSACTYRNVLAYWLDGTMPEKGKVCEVDAHPYGNITWDDVLEKVQSE